MSVLSLLKHTWFSTTEIVPRICSITSTKTFLSCPTPVLNKKKSVAEDIGLPDPPARPLKPFIKFTTSGHKHKDLAHLSWIEKVRKLSDTWNNKLTKEEKERRLHEYYEDKKDYQFKYEAYLQELTPQQIASLEQAVEQRKRSIENKKLNLEKKKELEKLGKPRKSGGGFDLFISTFKSKDEDTDNKTGFLKSVAAKWRELSIEERNEFLQRGADLTKQYARDIDDWEQRMLKEGRADLLRKKSYSLYVSKQRKDKKIDDRVGTDESLIESPKENDLQLTVINRGNSDRSKNVTDDLQYSTNTKNSGKDYFSTANSTNINF